MTDWQSHSMYLAIAVVQGRLSLEAALAQARALRGLREADLQRLDAYIGNLAGQHLEEAHLLALLNEAAAQTASPFTRFLCAYKVGMTHLRRGEAAPSVEALSRAVDLAEEAGSEQGRANALNSLGLAYKALGQVDQAIACYQEAIALSQQIGFRTGEGYALGNLGVAYYEQGYFAEALSCHQKALTISRETGDRGSEATDLACLGNVYRDMGRHGEALHSFQEALAIFRQLDDRWHEGETLGNIGLTYYFANKLEQAIETLEQGLAISRKTGNRLDVSNILGNLGNAYRDLGQVERAIGYYQQALDQATELGYWRGVGYHLSNLGLAYSLLGRVRESIGYYQQALEIGRQLGDRVGQCSRLRRIGNAYHRLGEVRQALEYYQEALILARQLDNLSQQVHCLNNLAVAYLDLRKTAQAIDCYRQALTLVQATGDAQGEGEVLCGLGSACCAGDQFQEGICYLEAALHIGRRQGDLHLQAVALGNLSSAWYGQGRLDRALEYGSQALQLCQGLNDRPLWGRVMINLGRAYRDVGNLTQAFKYLQEGQTLLRETGEELLAGRVHGHLGLAYQRAGILEQAVAAYQRALEDARQRNDRWDEGIWLTLLGDVLRVQGDDDQARQVYREALDINRQTANIAASCHSLYGLGLVCAYHDHDDEQAAAHFAGAVELAERWRRGLSGFDFQLLQAADWGALYQEMTLCALRRKRYAEAWACTERQKARALREWLVQTNSSPRVIQSELTAEDLSRFLPEEGTALVAFNVTHQGSAAFILHRQGVESGELPQDAGDWSPLPALTGPVGNPNLEVVTIPGFTRDDLEWMIISRERAVGLRAVVGEDYLRVAEPLGRAVGGWLVDYYRFQNERTDEVRTRWLATLAETGRVLYEKLLRPVIERLDALGVQRLILVPSLGLHLLPLHAASPGDPGEHTLLDDYEVSYAPGVLIWRHCREQETKACEGGLVAAANPTGDLPFAGYEVQSIQIQFPPGKSTTLWCEEATQKNVLVRAGEAGYLHLACHGLFDLVDPLESRLSLADGDLTLRDVLGQLRLSGARVVVLSACETGVSEFRALADEVIGLPAGFLMAGATAVVASLWAVNDLSTSLLMERFYHNLLTGQQRPSAALRAAQLWLRAVQAGELAARFEAERRKPDGERAMTYEQASAAWRRFVAMKPGERPFAHPYYWAAFTLNGD